MQNLFVFKVSYKDSFTAAVYLLDASSRILLGFYLGVGKQFLGLRNWSSTQLIYPPPPAASHCFSYILSRWGGRGGVLNWRQCRWTHPSRDDNEGNGLFLPLWPCVDRWNSYTVIQSRPCIPATLQLVSADTWTKPDTDPWESFPDD